MKKLISAIVLIASTGICLADPVTTVAEFTNAVAQAVKGNGSTTIELAAGVTFDLSVLEEYSEGKSWGTMSSPEGDANGISCVWWQKSLTIKGADGTRWEDKSSAQETIVDGGNRARIFYGYGVSGRNSSFVNITFRNGAAPAEKNGGALLFAQSESVGGASNCVFRGCSAVKGGAACAVPVCDSLIDGCSATSQGGGVYCDRNYCNMSGNVFRGCSVRGNGGAAYMQNMTASPAGHFSGCIVSNCTATGNGGGLYVVSGGVNNMISNCLFRANESPMGGAMYQGTATRCVFDSNIATTHGGACVLSVADRCVFVGNSTLNNRGGAMYKGSASGCGFTNNTCAAARGGACDKVDAVDCIFSGKGEVSCGSFNRCTFDGVVSDGNQMWMFDALKNNGESLGVTNCLVVNCDVGRIVNVLGQNASFVNCTFADNTIADKGYMVYADVNIVNEITYYSAASFENCLFSGNRHKDNTPADMKLRRDSSGQSTLAFSNCLYTDGLNDDTLAAFTDVTCAPANFVAGSGKYPGAPYYSPRRSSAARNAGLNAVWMASATDISGNARISDGTVDIGCYECVLPPIGMVIGVK